VSGHPLVVTVHALDLRGGDGLIGDAIVFAELDCRALCVATAVVPPEPVPLALMARQLEKAEGAGRAAAVRVGFVSGRPQVELIAGFVQRIAPESAVLAPVARVGDSTVLDAATLEAMRLDLFPAVRVVVARAVDQPLLTGREASDLGGVRDAARRLRDHGARAVVIAGLRLRGRVIDLLDDGGEVVVLDTVRIHVPRVHGLAGAYAAALAAHVGRGLELARAAEAAQRYVGLRLLRGR
jgi:hydroxymethylpyrimidine/phosphomethylpyrimidine kinase